MLLTICSCRYSSTHIATIQATLPVLDLLEDDLTLLEMTDRHVGDTLMLEILRKMQTALCKGRNDHIWTPALELYLESPSPFSDIVRDCTSSSPGSDEIIDYVLCAMQQVRFRYLALIYWRTTDTFLRRLLMIARMIAMESNKNALLPMH